ncbi:MAG: NAD(P)-binding domain-containing protein [Anaerolineales bacterium]|nr:NAD(P)-binding domain-containing protein [Anaerolineales bacterium]
MKVHLLQTPDEPVKKHFQALIDRRIRVSYGPLDEVGEFEVLVSGRMTEQELHASGKLTTLVIPFAGIPSPTYELLRDVPGLEVYNLHHNALPTAEMAITLMLAVIKQIIPADHNLRRGDWTLRYQKRTTRMAGGGQALILGYGAVGRHLASLCVGLGMRVTVVGRSMEKEHPAAHRYVCTDRLEEELPNCDVVFICLPLTVETKNFLDERRIEMLSESTVLINVGRGAIVNEKALYTALRDRRILGAGLDVWYRYPAEAEEREQTYPSAYPFHELDNVVLSPHMAGGVQGMEFRRMEDLAQLLNRLLSGDKPDENRVDLHLGY